MIEKKINHLDNHNYIVMEYSKIFLSMTDFMNLDTKYAIQEIENEKKTKKDKYYNKNQTSFFFEDYLETNKKNKSLEKKTYYRIEFIFYFFYFFL